MARSELEYEMLPSVLDRMLDDEPRVKTEAASGRSTTLSRLKASVKRDLEWLLNTKRMILDLPPDLPHPRNSVLNYGLPDFTHTSLGTIDDQRELRRTIEDAVRRFEPRLLDVVVTLLDGPAHERSVRFRIDAVLDVDPTPEAVTF